jgi:uncharacterized protein YbjT (DUF2867 family)
MNRILLIGATGNVGSQVVSQLLATGASFRAMLRKPHKAKFAAPVEVVQGDLTVPETLDGCLQGIDTVFLVWVAPPPSVVPALQRITRHVRRVVFLSAPLKTAHPLFQQPNAARALAEQIERLIESSGVEWTFLRPGMLASNAVSWWAPQIRRAEVVRWPYLSVPAAPIDERDIAAMAVRALCEEGHSGAEYVMTGPESLSHLEQIRTIGRVIGRPLEASEISPDEARRELLQIMPAPVIEMLLDAWGAAAGQPAFVSPTIERMTGHPPRSFEQWVRDNAEKFRS